jgi:hypothetical protein
LINDTGDIVGYGQSADVIFGFLRSSDGGYTSVVVPGAIATYAIGINNAGEIVGFYGDAAGRYHGFLATRQEEAENGQITTPGKLAVTYRTVEKCG